ncbi:MAG: FAD:protein FMN transferase [Synergistaceae bacterium]|nr:FAD:protein FMN transferase [Synergistaceae bacterium]
MKRKYIVAALLVLAGIFSWAIAPVPEVSRQGFAMNTLIRMTFSTKDEAVLDDAYSLLHELDAELSMYNPSSDISRINSGAGVERVNVPASVVEVVRDSVRVYELTEGVFNPLIGAVTRLWKINRADNTVPSREELDAVLGLSGIENLEIGDDYVYLKSKGCVLDLGGIAKGYASKKIADLAKSRGVTSGLIDLGGNIYAVGKKTDGETWKIGVRDPLEPAGNPELALSVEDCAVITSGGYERFKVVDGKRYSHFFDPKTGESVMSDVLSVTIVTPDGSLGDGLATAFMIAGVDESVRLLGKMQDAPGVIFIREKDGGPEILASMNLKDKIFRSAHNVKFFSPSAGI